MSFRWAWKVCRWCTHQGLRVTLWSIWLLLLAALAGQIHMLSARRVPVPPPLLRVLEKRLAEQGLRAEFGQTRMNFTGRFILENVRLGLVSTPTPLATARSVYFRIDPWDLLAGQVNLTDLRVSGLDLHLPPDAAGSGEDELPAHDIDFALHPLGSEIQLSHFTGYLGQLPVQAAGMIPLPAAQAASDKNNQVERISNAYLAFARQARDAEAWLAAFDSPRLLLGLNPAGVDVDFQTAGVDLSKLPGGHSGKLGRVQIKTARSFAGLRTAPIDVAATIASLDLPGEITAQELTLHLRGTPGGPDGFQAGVLDVQLGSLRWRGIETGPIAVTATQPSAGLVETDVSLLLAGSAWRVQGSAAPRTGEAQVSLDGFVGNNTLAFAGAQIGKDLSELLDPTHPAPLHATASFGPGWKLARASGRLHSGPVRVGGAHLDETGTEVSYDGNQVLCDNLVLRQGKSLAHGSYEMDAHTMDFRFLLTGGLEPAGIESWFHSWWSNFWSTFDFSRGLPDADVDVCGRWGDLTATRVFVQADGASIGLKTIPFDRVRTRLFLRPHWFDILHFDVAQAGQEADGWLTRSLDLTQDTWRYMEFSVDSTLPLETISKLFKAESAELLAPYRFTTPPRLKLTGRVDSPASPAGKHERIDIALGSTGAMTYHDFPLSDLTFTANLRDDIIDLPVLAVGFAQGKAAGKARLSGPENARRLGFDITLADANLGAVTQAVASLQSSTTPVTEKAAEAARLRQQRLEHGHLVFSLAAEGLYSDFYSFKGTGRAAITGAELAQLNLFGPLSEALHGTYFNLGSFSLTTVDAPLVLDGDKLRFESLRVSGPSALLQAKGDYHLRESRLDFTAKVYPFGESESLVGSAVGFVLSPLSSVFEVKLKGTLSDPSWIFAYGPSRLLGSITRSGDKSTRVSDTNEAPP